MSALKTLLFACLCASALAMPIEEKKQLKEKMFYMCRNARFQINLGGIAVDTQLFGAQSVELAAAESDEEKQCIKDVLGKSLVEGRELVAEIVGEKLPQLESMEAITLTSGSSDDQWQSVDDFLKSFNYDEYKKESFKKLKATLVTWIPGQQKKMGACITH